MNVPDYEMEAEDVVQASLPAYAANARMGHGVDYTADFYINSSGLATVSVRYVGNATTFTEITVETYIQKNTNHNFHKINPD
jgi:hypothetical protein